MTWWVNGCLYGRSTLGSGEAMPAEARRPAPTSTVVRPGDEPAAAALIAGRASAAERVEDGASGCR